MPSDYEQMREDNIRKYGTDTDHLKLLSHHYSNRTHFVFELLQNAEDAKASRILFTLFEDRLEVTHDGRIFNEQDVKGICGVGKGTKADDFTQIGKFGIGFKSVYVYTSAPEIFSGDECFRIKHYVRPYEIEPREIEEPWTTRFVLPFDTEVLNSEIAFQEIGDRLRKLDSKTMLFLRNIKDIEYQLPDDVHGIHRRHDIRDAGCMRQVEIGVEKENWLIFEKPIRLPDSHHQVQVETAFKLETDSNGNIEEIKQIHESPLFVYFPTEKDTRLGFLIQGPYRTTLARDNIPSDDTCNQKLIVETAALVVESMRRLKAMDLLTVSLLEVLPVRAEDFAQDSLFRPIFNKVREAFMNNELLPANDGTFVSASNAKLASGETIRNLLNHEQLSSLFDMSNENKWLLSEITMNRTPNLWQYLRNELKIVEVDPEMFARRLSEKFIEQQDDEWFIEFYRFLSGQRFLWIFSRHILQSKPILRLQDGNHVNPPHGDGSSPTAYLSRDADTNTSCPIIKVDLTQDEEVRDFLRGLGVPEWDIVEEVITRVLPKYECAPPTVPIEDHRGHFEIIERAYNTTDSHTKKTRLRDRLLETPFILAENTASGATNYFKPNQVYFGSDELRMYFEGNDSRVFVNLDEYPDSARELLEDLGDMDIVSKKEPNYEGHVVINNYHGQHKRGLNGFDPGIHVDGLEHAICNPTLEKSAFIWNCIAIPNSKCIRGIVEKSRNRHYKNSRPYERISDDFGRLLIETAWLPDSAGNMHRPRELTLDDLPNSFKRDVTLAKQLGMKKDEEAELAKKVGVPVEWIEVLKEAPPEVLNSPGTLEKIKELVGGEDLVVRNVTNSRSSNPEFPESPVKNPDHRAAKIDEELENSLATEFEPRERSVRFTAPREAARVWLKAEYTNNHEQMICQICRKEMPFKKRDGEYYFEAVEALDNEHFPLEHERQFLALCPECAARYQEFIKNDKGAMRKMIDRLIGSADGEIPLPLGELNPNLRFTEEHWFDFKRILKKSIGDTFPQ